MGKIHPTRVPGTARAWLQHQRFAPDAGRFLGLRVAAPPGWGKSRILGRGIAFQDAWRGLPVLLLDPTGGTIDEVLDQLLRQPLEVQAAIGRRLRLVPMAGAEGRVPAWPIYHRRPGEGLYAASQRYPDVVRRLDAQQLMTAPLLGWASFHPLATAVGMVLIALGLPITQAPDLLRRPETWQGRLAEAVQRDPAAAPAVRYLSEEVFPLKREDRERHTQAFLSRVAFFGWDDALRATYAAPTPTIDWDEVYARRLVVLVDLGHATDEAALQFGMLWVLRDVVAWVKRKGPHRGHPFSVIVDELTALTGSPNLDHELLAADLVELVARLQRSHRLFLTVAHQETSLLPEPVQRALLMLGNQLFGSVSDYETAVRLARRYHDVDPYAVKTHRTVYGSLASDPRGGSSGSVPIASEPIFFTPEEQLALQTQRFRRLPRAHGLAAIATEEGSPATTLVPVHFERLAPGQYVQEARVARVRSYLLRRDLPRVADVLAEIARRPVARDDVVGDDPGSAPATATRPSPPPRARSLRREPA